MDLPWNLCWISSSLTVSCSLPNLTLIEPQLQVLGVVTLGVAPPKTWVFGHINRLDMVGFCRKNQVTVANSGFSRDSLVNM